MSDGDAVNRSFGRYRLFQRLASGGMASVYLAQVQGPGGFEKWVAIKTVHPHCTHDSKFIRMFLDEARLTARLSHPNVCTVFDFGQVDGTYFIAMEYLRGEPLRSVMNKGVEGQPMPRELLARLVADAARGLHSAHEAVGEDGESLGIVHRDVSPQNLFVLYDGIAKVVDFGIARARDRLADTTTGELKGKFAYMAPEQLDNKVVDRRSDVFSLGIVLWEATVLRRLFKRESTAMTVASVLRDTVPRPTELRPDYAPELEAVVMRALERDPGARFQSMDQMADALDAYILSTRRPAGTAQVAAWMKSTFADRIEHRSTMMRLGATAEVGLAEFEPSASSTVASGASASAARSPGPSRRLGAALALAVVVLLAATAAFGGWYLGRRGGEAGTSAGVPSDPAPAPQPPVERPEEAGTGRADGHALALLRPEPIVPPGPEDDPVAGPRPDSGPAPTVEGQGSGPPPARSPTPSPEPGYLNLISVPVAQVWLAGRDLGTTPLQKVRVPAGRHRLKLRAVRGEGKLGQTVTIRPREVTYLSVRLER